ncbi:MAG: RluA family pseudouridine synthase [Planctomycetota bacterium]
MKPLEILYEDNHLLIVNKPALLATMGVAEDKPSVLSLAKEYVKQKYEKPGNVYLGVVSRLDAPVTGVLVMARTSKAASRLSEQFRNRDVDKVYRAVVEGVPDKPEACLLHWLRKDERHRRVHVTMKDKDTAQEARLRYRLIRELAGDLSLLEVKLETGRKHQIRVQLSAIGHPIVGDRKYKSNVAFSEGIALHSYYVKLTHPVKREPIEITVSEPPSWRGLLRDVS